jgi:tRNA(Ile)-lysidine synthase
MWQVKRPRRYVVSALTSTLSDMAELAQTAAATAAAHGMFPEGAPVVVMVSGGADSVSLLRAVAAGVFGRLRAAALHVDHRLRGDASDADAAFVERLCADLGVPCRVARVDVAAYADELGLNLEDAGRRVRYREADEYLDALCAEAGVAAGDGRVATAHTLDDRAETTLMRLAQGAGAGGLVSPPHRRGRVVRPLLDCTRADVLAYLDSLGQTWREDATNLDTTRTRARVRAELMPLMRGINPRFDEAIARTIEVLGDEDALLDGMARTAAAALATAGTEISADREDLAALPRALQRRVLRLLLRETFPESSRLDFEHLEAVCDGLPDPSFARDIGSGLRAFAEYGRLIISRSGEQAGTLTSRTLTVPGTVDLERAGRIVAEPGGAAEPPSDPRAALIDADAITGPLSVTAVLPGDRMRPFGMQGTRKVSDILIDAKVPARQRTSVPVVRDGERIVWVAGVKSSDDYRVGPHTVRTVRLVWEPSNPEGDA